MWLQNRSCDPSAFGVNSLPSASSSKLPVHRSPCGNRLIVPAFTNTLAVPKSTVLDTLIGPKYTTCSNRESRGPRRRLDACKGTLAHRTVPRGWNSAPSHISLTRCLAVSAHRKQTVHAGCIRHKPRQQIMVCWHFDTRS